MNPLQEIRNIQSAQLNETKKAICKDCYESEELIEKFNKAVAEAVACGKAFVHTAGIQACPPYMRYYQCMQFIRSCEANISDLRSLYFNLFGEEIPPKPEPEPEVKP